MPASQLSARSDAALVVDDDLAREPKDGCHRRPGLLQTNGRFRCRQLDGLGGHGPLVGIVVARRPTASPVGGGSVVVRLVHWLPTADEISECLCGEVDETGPVGGAIRFDQEPADVSEPLRQSEMVETHPRRDSKVAGRTEYVSVTGDGVVVVDALLGLDA